MPRKQFGTAAGAGADLTTRNDAVAVASADGCCRLSAASTTSLKLSPLNGNTLWVGAQACTVPTAGASASNSGLSASTFYYVYAAASGGAVSSLSFSATGYLFDGTGRAYKSNGASTPAADGVNRLVGWVITNGSSQFQDAATFRGVGNWFNRRTITFYQVSSGAAATTSTSAVILLGASTFAVWADEPLLHVDVAGNGHTSANSGLITQVNVNGSGVAPQTIEDAANTGGVNFSFSLTTTAPAEQIDTVAPYGAAAYGGATATWDAIVCSGYFRG